MKPGVVRCPGHTVQFSGYEYSKYIKEVLGVVGINADTLEWKRYESWTLYNAAGGEDRLETTEEGQP